MILLRKSMTGLHHPMKGNPAMIKSVVVFAKALPRAKAAFTPFAPPERDYVNGMETPELAAAYHAATDGEEREIMRAELELRSKHHAHKAVASEALARTVQS
jgi:hypothetical protein